MKRLRFIMLILALGLIPGILSAQFGRGGFGSSGPAAIPLWEDGAPGSVGDTDADIPELTFYRARGTGTAVIIAPGGAYGMLSMDNEGRQEAYWFNSIGVSAFVLRYRLGPRYHFPVQLEDAQRAIRIVRSRAEEFGIQPDQIGMMGFSAGGHLTSTTGTHFDAGDPGAADPIERASNRPDFMILCYPVVSFQPEIAGDDVLGAYAASGRNLLGEDPDPKLLMELSNELEVTAETPPTFLYHTTNDSLVSVENSVAFYLALKKEGVPAEMHLFENGRHGTGMGMGDPALSAWPTLLMNWMRGRGLLARAASGGRGGN